MERVNLFDAEFEYDDNDPSSFRSGFVRVSKLLGAQALAAKAFELPLGEAVCPYHYEYEEEWLVVLDGTVTVRTPQGDELLVRGDTVFFPAGPDGAHKVENRTAGDTARVLMFSSAREPSVAIYPDSDKIGVWPGNAEDHVILRRADGHVGYWDGEA